MLVCQKYRKLRFCDSLIISLAVSSSESYSIEVSGSWLVHGVYLRRLKTSIASVAKGFRFLILQFGSLTRFLPGTNDAALEKRNLRLESLTIIEILFTFDSKQAKGPNHQQHDCGSHREDRYSFAVPQMFCKLLVRCSLHFPIDALRMNPFNKLNQILITFVDACHFHEFRLLIYSSSLKKVSMIYFDINLVMSSTYVY